MLLENAQDKAVFEQFIATHNLSLRQQEQFLLYIDQVRQTNEKFNITALTSVQDIILYHFHDSIMLGKFLDLSSYKGIADVGTGGGFPGLALKIIAPEVPVYLIEVNQKKCAFLQDLAEQLGLVGVHVIEQDWRTFLRHTSYEIDLVVARASLQFDELLRMYKPSSAYKTATLVYWASQYWHPDEFSARCIAHTYSYQVADKTRLYIVSKGMV